MSVDKEAKPQIRITASLVAQMVKQYACNAGDPGSIPGSEDPLEKGMATYSNILAWRISWTEGPGGLQSMRSERVGHGSVINSNF